MQEQLVTEQNSLGELIDSSIDRFQSYVAKNELGLNMSINNLLKSTYETLRETKDQLVLITKQPNAKETMGLEDYHKSIETIKGLSVKMAKIEVFVLHLTELIQKRTEETRVTTE